MNTRIISCLLAALLLASAVVPTHGQFSIPDPGLNAAVRAALQKPAGPITPQDMLSLTNLNAQNRKVKSIAGLEAAANLSSLDLSGNLLTNLTLAPDFAKLVTLVLNGNPLTTLVLSQPLAATNLAPLVAALENQGVSVFTYPLEVRLVRLLALIGAFKFGITGPPGA